MFMRKDIKSESEVSFFVIQPGFLVHNPPGWKDVWSAFSKSAVRRQHPGERYGALITKKQVKQRSLW